jgi:hypothetical protein
VQKSRDLNAGQSGASVDQRCLDRVSERAQPSEAAGLTRRDFFKVGAAAGCTVICWNAALRDVVANSRATGNPVLTADHLNQRFAQARTIGTLRALAASIKTGPAEWIRSNYSLTELQSHAVRSIPETHWNEITRVLSFVENNRGASLSVAIRESGSPQSRKCTAIIRVTSEAQVGAESLKAEAEARTT